MVKIGPLEITFARTPTTRTATRGEIGTGGVPHWHGLLSEDEYNADLRGVSGLKTYERMLNDDAISAAREAIMRPLIGVDYRVDPASDSPRDREIAEMVEGVLFGMKLRTWREFVAEAYGFADYGHYSFEPVWNRDGAGRVVLDDLAPRPPKTLQDILTDSRGRLDGIRQNNVVGNDGPATVDLMVQDGKLLHFVRGRTGNNWRGKSIWRSAYKPWKVKETIETLHAISLELRASGLLVAKFDPDDMSPEQVAALDAALRRVGTREQNFLRIPHNVIVEMLSTTGAIPDALEATRYLDLRIFRAVRAEHVAMGEGSSGSLAMHRDKTSDFIAGERALARVFTEAVNCQLIPLIVRFNVGDMPTEELPKLAHDALDTRNVPELAASVATFKGAGFLHAQPQDENAIRRMLDWEEVDEAELEADGTANGDAAGAAVGAGVEDKQKTALNGAQVSAAKEVVERVAVGALPRESGVNMLIAFFQLTREAAEAIMGDVGRGFVPQQAPDPQQPAPEDGEPDEAEPEADAEARRAMPPPQMPDREDDSDEDEEVDEADRQLASETVANSLEAYMQRLAESGCTHAAEGRDDPVPFGARSARRTWSDWRAE